MATVDDRFSGNERGDTSCHDDRVGGGVESLCDGARFLGLSNAGSPLNGLAQSSPTISDKRATIAATAPIEVAQPDLSPETCGHTALSRLQEAATGEAELARILSPLFPLKTDDAAIFGESSLAVTTGMPGSAAVPAAASALAKRLIGEFGSLTALLAARPETVRRLLGPDEHHQHIADFLKWLGEGFVTALRFEIQRSPIIGNSTALIDYLHMTLACQTAEQFRVFFLDSARRLIRDEQLGIGSITATSVSPREIVKRALELGATSLILVHNHPSGDTRPSSGDIEITAKIARAARCLDIAVTDHIIIARTGWTSMRNLGML